MLVYYSGIRLTGTRIGDKSTETTALSTLQTSPDLLQPEDAVTEQLSAVRPIYSASFIFADEAGDLCLMKSFRETEDAGTQASAFEETSKKWTRLERDSHSTVPLLDASLSDLNTGKAWQFDIEASQAVDESRLSKKLVDFSYGLQFGKCMVLSSLLSPILNNNKGLRKVLTFYLPWLTERDRALKQSIDKPFISHRSSAAGLKHTQHRISYRYHLRTKDGFVTDYTLDLTRFQDRKYTPTKTPLLAGAEPTIYEPRWSLNVYRTEWDSKFAQNARLKIGEGGNWPLDVDSWFPEDPQSPQPDSQGAGFAHLMENLKRVGRVIEPAKIQDLMGGMTIG